ncbi:MAG TPA: hypothetical protein VMD51_06105 [Mycobacterium sp.]|nr:hypothetical protein [Mycobacterium sp.]
MPAHTLVAAPTTALMAVAMIASTPAQATPQCRYGDHVTADCPSGECLDVIDAQNTLCVGPELDSLLPPAPPVRVELGFGAGV